MGHLRRRRPLRARVRPVRLAADLAGSALATAARRRGGALERALPHRAAPFARRRRRAREGRVLVRRRVSVSRARRRRRADRDRAADHGNAWALAAAALDAAGPLARARLQRLRGRPHRDRRGHLGGRGRASRTLLRGRGADARRARRGALRARKPGAARVAARPAAAAGRRHLLRQRPRRAHQLWRQRRRQRRAAGARARDPPLAARR